MLAPAGAHQGSRCTELTERAYVEHARGIVKRAYAQKHWRDPSPFAGRPARKVARHRRCISLPSRERVQRYREARHKAFHVYRERKVKRRREAWRAVTVKHVPSVRAQRHTLRVILDNGERREANARVQVSQIITVTQEKVAYNTPGGDRDSSCAFQQRASTGWPGDLCDLRNQSDNFLWRAPTYPGGAIAYERQHPGAAIYQIADAIQRSCCPTAYAAWEGEAWDTLRAWRGLP